MFHTTSAAFAAEKALVKSGISCKLIPTPREFSSDCGVALRFGWADLGNVTRALESAGVETSVVRRM